MINLLCAADLHLGREVGYGPHGSSVKRAWERLVDRAITMKPTIHALLLAGDLFDGDELFVELYSLFRKGVQRLQEANIPLIAICGNHDAMVLQELHNSLGSNHCYFLGKNRGWERVTLNLKSATLHIDGYSFSSPQMEENPLDCYNLPPVAKEDHLIGLLHCDVDATKSRYAPVPRDAFFRFDHQAWILGHIHIPTILLQRPLVFYCGSLQGLDIGEEEERGAVLLTIDGKKTITHTPLPLAPFLWKQLSIDCEHFSLEGWREELFARIGEELTDYGRDSIEALGVRLRLRGRTALFRKLLNFSNQCDRTSSFDIRIDHRSIPLTFESIVCEVQPPHDLARLAAGCDLVALLARKIERAKEDPSLKTRVHDRMEKLLAKEPFLKQCQEAWPDEEDSFSLYQLSAYQLLDELLAQKSLEKREE